MTLRDGTLILTSRGAVAIEALSVGDLVISAAGEPRPVRALIRHAPRRDALLPPRSQWPVRVAAQACGPGRPSRDLFLSPEHAICLRLVDEVLIPAVALANDATVARVTSDGLAYWHIELDRDDLLVANGLPVESRCLAADDQAAVDAASPADTTPRTHGPSRWQDRALVREGALVQAARSQMLQRLAPLGWRQVQPPPQADLHLVVDGRRLEPVMAGMAARFHVPAARTDIGLVSSTVMPRDIVASADERALGVCLAGLVFVDGFETRVIALDDPRLGDGLHGMEGEGSAIWRWSYGLARLPPTLWEGMDPELFLRIDLARPALPRWMRPYEPDEEARP